MNKKTITTMMSKYDYEYDNYGQVIFYSGWYQHSDGELYDEPEEGDNEYEEDEDEED